MKTRACRLWVREYFIIDYAVITFLWESVIEFVVFWFITMCLEILTSLDTKNSKYSKQATAYFDQQQKQDAHKFSSHVIRALQAKYTCSGYL